MAGVWENIQNPSMPWISIVGVIWKSALTQSHQIKEDRSRYIFRGGFWTTQSGRTIFLLWWDSPCFHKSCSVSVCRLGMPWEAKILFSGHVNSICLDQKRSSCSCLSRMMFLCFPQHCNTYLHTYGGSQKKSVQQPLKVNVIPHKTCLNTSLHSCK